MKHLLVALALFAALLGGPSPASTQTHHTRLGVSLFWAMGGNLRYWPQLGANLAYARDVIGADYIRVIAVVGGDTYRNPEDGQYYDPWADLAIPPTDLQWEPEIQRVTDSAAANGLKVHWTILGTRAYVPTAAAQDDAVRFWFRAMQTRLHHVELLEIANEYNINGFTVAEVQRMGRLARTYAPPGFPITLSSPGGTHTDVTESELRRELAELYSGPDFAGANVFTYHASRVTDRWRPASILRLLGPVARRNSEPRGPGASAGGDTTDAGVVTRDYLDSIRAGEAGYVYHTSAGVWGGHAIGFTRENRWPNLWDVPNADGIASGLRTLRRDGTPGLPAPPDVPVPTPPPPVPGDPIAVLMDLVRRVEILEALARRAGLLP